MKVMQLCYGLNVGGVQNVAINISNALINQGVECIYCYRVDGNFYSRLDGRIKRIQYYNKLPKKTDIINGLLIKKLIDIAIKENIDIIHSYDLISWITGTIVSRITNIPIIRTQPNFISIVEPTNKKTIKFLPFAKWTSKFHTIFDATTKDLISSGIPKSKVIEISNTLLDDEDEDDYISIYEKFNIQKNCKIIVTIGRIVAEDKGWEILPYIAYNIIKKYNDVIFLLIGSGSLKNKV
jgi:hypothetical protein